VAKANKDGEEKTRKVGQNNIVVGIEGVNGVDNVEG